MPDGERVSVRPGDWVRDEDGRRGFVLFTDIGGCCVTIAYTSDLSTWRSPDGLTVLAHNNRGTP